ncbi:phosphatase PAP2 family protein [Marvinbryantia formatexigens DSM 14469]|nr:phosphatase PAP2 family protein [Marvinbryantia formatexigens]UWO27020.1 phosphatase PAP2 family protein [Marvinbryantia formatexigens DSM 14469]
MEWMILDWIQSIRTPAGDVIIPFITKLGNMGMIWILLAVLLLLIPKTRKAGAIMLAALCVDLILCNGILKNLVGRLRPCDVNTGVQLLIARPHDFSFPSGHTASSFAAVTALYLAGERKLWKPALVLAVLIAFSRLYLYVHYPTDIFGGVVVGIISGIIGFWAVGRLEKWRKRHGGMEEKAQ